MARARNIKPAFFKNEFLAQLSPHARLLFPGLWMLADRAGRLEDRPLRIKGELFPFENVDVDALLNELATSPGKFIIRYEVNGEAYIQVSNFQKHQNPHKQEKESTIPEFAPCESGASTEEEQFLHGTSTVQVPTLIGTAPENNGSPPVIKGTAPADSLLLIPDSLTLKTDVDANASVCECDRFAEEGYKHILSLNSPNVGTLSWVKGYLSIQFKELEQNRPDLTKSDILTCWRDTCDDAVSKNKLGTGWLKSVFKSKVEEYDTKNKKSPVPRPVSMDTTDRDQLLKFPYVKHRFTQDPPIPTSELEVKPDDPQHVYHRHTPHPVWMLEGLEEADIHV